MLTLDSCTENYDKPLPAYFCTAQTCNVIRPFLYCQHTYLQREWFFQKHLRIVLQDSNHKVGIICHELNAWFLIREDNSRVLEADSFAVFV